jgi:hypothetical protein
VSVTTDILTGAAARIAALASPAILWSPAGTYSAAQTGIFLKLLPAAPDRCVTLNLVPQGDDPSMPYGQSMLQVRGRGLPNKPTDVDDLLDSIFDVMHGAVNLTFGACHITQMNRRTSVPMGMDDSKRWERIDQFYLDVDYPPTTARPDGGFW